MKTIFKIIAMCVLIVSVCSCQNKKQEPEVVVPPPPAPVEEVEYQPQHLSSVVDLAAAKKYEYFNAPRNEAAVFVELLYNDKIAYAHPISIRFHYAKGDTYTYTIPSEFGLRTNENGKFRILSDNEHTVWIQGQTKRGKFHEFVFYGDPKYNGSKIKPNSYRNHPSGEIKYK